MKSNINNTISDSNQTIENLYGEYCRESFDNNGSLESFEPVYPADFNFAYDVVDRIADIQPDRRAMIWINDCGEERMFTFGDIKRASDRTANMLRANGVKKGDMVMLVLRRHYQFWFSILALHKLGAIAINSTDMLTKKDYAYRFKAAGIKYIIATAEGEAASHIDRACENYPGMAAKFLVSASQNTDDSRDGWISFNSEMNNSSDKLERVPTSAHDPLLLYFTSGTTGNPKMALHDHTYPLGHIISAKYWHGITGDDLHLTVADTGWAKASWGKIYGQWFMGASLFIYDFLKFDPLSLMTAVSEYKVTTFCAPATIYRFFIKESMGRYDLSHIRHATTAGEALNAEVFNRFYDLTGLKIQEAFGQTETTAVTANLLGRDMRPGSMGKPSPLYKVAVVDENGDPVSAGEVGELCIAATPDDHQVGLFRGYYRDGARTREAWHDGLYHTGDTAWMDEDGYLWYVGRVDDVIKASGYRIGPFEIESVLMEHPAVRECAVTGVSDPVRGTVVKATIILSGNNKGSAALKKELQEYVKAQTAPYKYPRIIDFVDELPKTFSGKIKRADIRKKDAESGQATVRMGA